MKNTSGVLSYEEQVPNLFHIVRSISGNLLWVSFPSGLRKNFTKIKYTCILFLLAYAPCQL